MVEKGYIDAHVTISRCIHSWGRLTPKKLRNLFLNTVELKLRRPILYSKPPFARINPYPFCNLHCPACLVGRQNSGQAQRFRDEYAMHPDTFRKCLDQLADTLIRCVLYDEGEPLLHPDIFTMVAYADERNVSTTVSTNLSMRMDDARIDELVNSGLDHLIVAMDGTTQDIYARYRVGGDLSILQSNLERIIAKKRQLRRKRPVIELQTIDLGFNTHQIKDARAYSRAVRADVFRTFRVPPESLKKESVFEGSEEERLSLGCYHIWSVADVGSGGDLFACDYGEDHGMPPIGSLLDTKFDLLWNCDTLVNMRRSFHKGCRRVGSQYCSVCWPNEAAPPRILR